MSRVSPYGIRNGYPVVQHEGTQAHSKPASVGLL
jgi:hypothetical protein